MSKRKMAMPLKTGLILCLSAAVFFSISIGTVYIAGFRSMRAALGASHSKMAAIMSSGLTSLLDKEIEILKSVSAGEDAVKKALIESNSLYQGIKMQGTDLASSLRGREAAEAISDKSASAFDKSSGRSPEQSRRASLPLVTRNDVLENHPEITQVCAINRFGVLAASSGQTETLYYGNQEWWKDSFGAGKSSVLVGEPQIDPSTGAWVLPFIIPLTGDKTSGDFIGAIRYLVKLESFFDIFKGFKIGRTGEAVIVDDKGYLVFSAQVRPFSNKLCSYDELQRMSEDDENAVCFIGSVYMHQGPVAASFSKIELPVGVKSGIKWRVFVIQDKKEVFAFLNSHFLKMIWLAVILTLLLLIAGFVIGRQLTAPIRALQDGMVRVGAGDIEYRVKAMPADEIGRLIGSFNDMLDSLKTTSTSVSKMDSEIAKRDEEIRKLTQAWSGLIKASTHLRDSVSETRKILGSILSSLPRGGAVGKSGQPDSANRSAIENAIKSMEKLLLDINSLFDIGSIDTGEMSLTIAPVDIRSIMHDVIFFFEPKIREKGLDFRLDVPKAKLEVLADAERIKRVLYSIVDNAHKFTEKGYIAISVKELKNEVECSVTDTGIGISKEDINRIFDRLQNSGLSLFIAKNIINLHNGRIWVESELKKGTKFIFRLPKPEAKK